MKKIVVLLVILSMIMSGNIRVEKGKLLLFKPADKTLSQSTTAPVQVTTYTQPEIKSASNYRTVAEYFEAEILPHLDIIQQEYYKKNGPECLNARYILLHAPENIKRKFQVGGYKQIQQIPKTGVLYVGGP